jgi:hypothetical protein
LAGLNRENMSTNARRLVACWAAMMRCASSSESELAADLGQLGPSLAEDHHLVHIGPMGVVGGGPGRSPPDQWPG